LGKLTPPQSTKGPPKGQSTTKAKGKQASGHCNHQL